MTLTEAGGPTAIFGLEGVETRIGGLCVARDVISRLQLPDEFTAEHLDTARNDLALLSEVMSQKPDELRALQNAVIAQNPDAKRLAVELGLTEENAMANGGGILALVILVVVLALTLESDTPPTPDAGGAPDGGVG